MVPNKRKEVEGLGIVLGVVVSKDGRCLIHSATWDCWDLLKKLMEAIFKLIHVPPDFSCTSIQFLKSATVKEHTDANAGKSLIVSYGHFSGGALLYGGDKLDTLQSAKVIDGQISHSVEPFYGTSYSMALYTHPRYTELAKGVACLS